MLYAFQKFQPQGEWGKGNFELWNALGKATYGAKV